MNKVKLFHHSNTDLIGSNLLEASAGTGKTHSIVWIYLRFILEKDLKIDDILVTTFTTAAVSELKTRIYDFLQDALNVTLSIERGDTDTKLDRDLVDFLLNILNKKQIGNIKNNLYLAISTFGQAKISSIDGFLLSLLTEYSIHTGINPPDKLITDIEELSFIDIAFKEYVEGLGENNISNTLWDFLYKKSSSKVIQDVKNNKNAFLRRNKILKERKKNLINNVVESFFNFKDSFLKEQNSLDFIYELANQNYLNRIKFRENKDNLFLVDKELINELTPLIKELVGNKKVNIDTIVFLKEKVAFLSHIYSLVNEGRNSFKKTKINDAEEIIFTNFSVTSLSDVPLLRLLCLFFEACSSLPIDFSNELISISDSVKKISDNLKLEKEVMTYQDVTEHVLDACNKGLINTSYKAILVDEVQDSNQEQIDILSSLFIDKNIDIFFVGDVKQAIYRFRGGDVYAYKTLSERVQKNYRLNCNYRSSKGFNESINLLFKNLSTNNNFNYSNVSSFWTSPEKDVLQFCIVDDKSGKNLNDFICLSADIINNILEKEIPTTFLNKDEKKEVGKKIGALVFTNKQAIELKKELEKRGINSVIASKKNVFLTESSYYLRCLIQAIYSLENSDIKLTLSQSFFSFNFSEITEELCSNYTSLFKYYQKIFYERSFSIGLSKIFEEERLLANLLNNKNGEYLVANLLHIIELIQKYTKDNNLGDLTIDLALDIFDKSFFSSEAVSQKSLGSTSVTIQTIHASKGLDYDFVVLLNYKHDNKRKPDIVFSRKEKTAWLKTPDNETKEEKSQALKEELDETLRLYYVALTRAKRKNIIIDYNKDGLPSLLDTLGFCNNKKQQEDSFFSYLELEKNIEKNKKNEERYLKDRKLKYLNSTYYNSFQLESFSKLSSYQNDNKDSRFLDRFSLGEVFCEKKSKFTEGYSEYSLGDSLEGNDKDIKNIKSVWENYPKGPQAGLLLHELFEIMMDDRTLLESSEKDISTLYPLISKYPFSIDNMECFLQSVRNILKTKLLLKLPCGKNQSIKLADIDVEKQSIEMSFYLYLNEEERLRVLRDLNFETNIRSSSGYLYGFIDLMFFYEGRYYILDYKSNYLGSLIKDYNKESMNKAMLEHKYYQQAHVYSLAVYQHLKTLLGSDFNYHDHFGGVIYLFVRGLDKETGVFHFIPDKGKLIL